MNKIFLVLVIFILFIQCNGVTENTFQFSGEAQGTTYQITYLDESGKNYQEHIDSIFSVIDLSLSTYVPSSIISLINKDSSATVDQHFINVFNEAQEIAAKTNGYFDVTVAPIINAWGFGYSKKETVDSNLVDSLLKKTGYELVQLEGVRIIKKRPGLMLDFNAIAQGYTVDVLADFIEGKNIKNYLIELGGEVKTKGRKKNGELWTVGIDQPNEKSTEGRPLQAIIKLENRALATSGNYRKFYVENGQKYSHIIDPHTGYPAKNNLLSTTVIAPNCMRADAYATAFMVMGLEKSKQFLQNNPDLQLEVFFIYDESGKWKTFTSEKLKQWVREIN